MTSDLFISLIDEKRLNSCSCPKWYKPWNTCP